MDVQSVTLPKSPSKWLIYFRERFPLPVYLLMAGGFARSGNVVGGEMHLGAGFFYSFLGVLGFFALLRLMDELKDYEKDLLAHPERPLPRGLLSTEEAERAVNTGAVLMLAYAAIGAAFFNVVAGLNYLVLTAYLWLMYREFYVGNWLEKRQLLYAGSHQLVLVMLCTFCVFTVNPAIVSTARPYWFGLLILGSFFSYEVCRKLDPKAHPLLRTYRSLYGARGSFALVAVATLLAAVAGWWLSVGVIVWPAECLVLVAYISFVGSRHKLVEGVAALSLCVHLYAITLMGVFP